MSNFSKLIKEFQMWSREDLVNRGDLLGDKGPLDSWAFIRLYYYEYRKWFDFNNISKSIIKLFSETSDHGKSYTHASINYCLNDFYYGLNPGSFKNKLRIERLTKDWDDDPLYNSNKCKAKSHFTIIGVPIREVERITLGSWLREASISNKLKYDYIKLVQTGFAGLRNKIAQAKMAQPKNFTTLDSSAMRAAEEEGEILAHIEGGYVCSSFVAHALSEVNPELKEYFETNHKSVHDYTPTALTTLPNSRILFEGSFEEYDRAKQDFLNKNPEFKRFLTDK